MSQSESKVRTREIFERDPSGVIAAYSCHLNEGHAAFAILEHARSFMEENAQPFEVALTVTRAGNLFTTHTAVAAGFDRFAPALIEQYLGGYAEQKLGITRHDLLALGRQSPNDASEPFNMAYLAIRGSGTVNGVSQLQLRVSRHLFEHLFPHWFYARDEQGIPNAWMARMRESTARLTLRFSANRAVREYTEQHYRPAASTYRERAADNGASGVDLVDWRHALERKWAALRFGEVKLETDGGQHVLEVQMYLDDLDPEVVRVELYANGVNGSASERVEVKRVRQLVGAINGYAYRAGRGFL
jgi:glucan phosphorylase